MLKQKQKKLFKRGDAVILLSVLISGLVILISAIATQNLKKSMEVQGVQKKSLNNLYKAEEGIESGLFTAKESTGVSATGAVINLWKKVGESFKLESDISGLMSSTPKDDLVITSKNAPEVQSDGSTQAGEDTTKVLISNIPNTFPDQTLAWDYSRGCQNDAECPEVEEKSSTGNNQLFYQAASQMANYDERKIPNAEYRFIFKCARGANCQVGTYKNGNWNDKVTLKYASNLTSCDYSKCPFVCGSETPFEVPMESTGTIISKLTQTRRSQWFQPGANLNGKGIIVEFWVKETGKGLGGIKLSKNAVALDGTNKMCKREGSNGSYQGFNDQRIGLVKINVRNKRK